MCKIKCRYCEKELDQKKFVRVFLGDTFCTIQCAQKHSGDYELVKDCSESVSINHFKDGGNDDETV